MGYFVFPFPFNNRIFRFRYAILVIFRFRYDILGIFRFRFNPFTPLVKEGVAAR